MCMTPNVKDNLFLDRRCLHVRLQASHVIGQVMEQAAKLESSLGGGPAEEHDEVYVCLWAGCKVLAQRQRNH